MNDTLEDTQKPSVSLDVALWARIGCLSFGGPAGQIALMHRLLVEERRFLDQQRFLAGLSFCMLLPGPEAQQLATYVGFKRGGWRGAVVAGSLFVLPGVVAMALLCLAYVHFGHLGQAQNVLLGLKCAVIAIVIEALLRLGRRALIWPGSRLLALGSFVGVFFFGVPFPILVIAAALAGFLSAAKAEVVSLPPARHELGPSLGALLAWALPVGLTLVLTGSDSVFSRVTVFFSQVAVITFGGAYAVLSYVADHAVGQGWLSAAQMADGLGLAETTPGPLILVLQFVAFMAGWGNDGNLGRALGVSLLGVWVLFAPSFFWIFVGAPAVERLNADPRLRHASNFVSAAVLGAILNLALFFALHVLFANVERVEWGLLSFQMPVLESLLANTLAPLASALVVLFGLKRSVLETIAAAVVVALLTTGF